MFSAQGALDKAVHCCWFYCHHPTFVSAHLQNQKYPQYHQSASTINKVNISNATCMSVPISAIPKNPRMSITNFSGTTMDYQLPHSLGEKDENVNYACSFILFALHGIQHVICEWVYSMLHTLGRMQCCLE